MLPISQSGLGLVNSHLISYAAFVASRLECFLSTDIQKISYESGHEISNSMCHKHIITSLEKIQEYDHEVNIDLILHRLQDGSYKNLQNELSKVFNSRTRNETIQRFDDRNKVLLNCFNNAESGLFFSVAPKTNLHTFTNKQFQSTLCFRLCMRQPCLLATSHACATSCRNQVDPQGFHFATGCCYGGVRIAMHNDVVRRVQDICRYSGLNTKMEPINIFQGNDRNIGDGCRPDLTIYNFGPKYLACDVRVTSGVPANGRILSAAQVRNKGLVDANLQDNYNEKVNKYGRAAADANYDFLPMVADVGGKLHSEFKNFLTKILKHASEVRNIPFPTLWRFWISALMATLQRGRANSMIKLSSKVFNREVYETFETSDQVVSRCMYTN
jgi:hypothetical protein